MIEVIKSATFDRWIASLRDRKAVLRILVRIDRLAAGLTGDAKPVGEGVAELRIDHGPGYRVYYIRRGSTVVVLLCGGDKASQRGDIAAAKAIAKQWKDAT